MKKLILPSAILLLTSVILITVNSCKKKTETKTEDPAAPISTTSNVDQFFTSNAASIQVYTINSATLQTITGIKGTVISIPKNAFVVASTNSAVTSGTVEISLQEIYSKKDMILNMAQTVSGNDFLESGGEINITAKQGTNTLKMAPGKKISISMPTPPTPSTAMRTFYGNVNTAGQMNWALNTNSTAIVANTSSSVSYYTFYADSLHWINCDAILCMSCPLVSYSVNISGAFDKNNTRIVTVFPSINGMMSLYPYTNSPQTYYGSSKLPNPSNAVVVAISEIGGQYYSAFQTLSVTPSAVYNLTMTPTTTAQIVTQLNAL